MCCVFFVYFLSSLAVVIRVFPKNSLGPSMLQQSWTIEWVRCITTAPCSWHCICTNAPTQPCFYTSPADAWFYLRRIEHHSVPCVSLFLEKPSEHSNTNLDSDYHGNGPRFKAFRPARQEMYRCFFNKTFCVDRRPFSAPSSLCVTHVTLRTTCVTHQSCLQALSHTHTHTHTHTLALVSVQVAHRTTWLEADKIIQLLTEAICVPHTACEPHQKRPVPAECKRLNGEPKLKNLETFKGAP